MGKKKLIWIIGATASGKSTLRRTLVNLVATNKNGTIVSEPKREYTDYGNTAVLGKCKENGVCDGLDRSFNHMTKDGCIDTVEYCIKNFQYTFIEGAMATRQWILPFCEMCMKYGVKFYLIHINMTLWKNYKRLVKRVINRGGSEEDIKDSMLDRVRGSSVQMRKLYNKCADLGFIRCLQINGDVAELEDKVTLSKHFLKIK